MVGQINSLTVRTAAEITAWIINSSDDRSVLDPHGISAGAASGELVIACASGQSLQAVEHGGQFALPVR